jgi:3-oxoacyl-[acyl-carrier protein] reductase
MRDAAKAGLAGLTRALAHDLAPDGITVNCVVPGLIGTVRGHAATGGPPAHHAHAVTLLGRRGRPEEVASLVRYLVGPEARYLTGQSIHANGGALMP